VDYLNCPADPGSLCVSVWKSEPGQSLPATPGTSAGPTAAGAFNKSTPSNNATGVDPNNTHLTWTSSANADKYAYCVQQSSACADNDPDWTSSFDRDVTVSGLGTDRVYYWQVRATDCDSCTPKPWTYANSDTPWKFTTSVGATITILGNAGAGGATLTYVSGSTTRTTTADSTGAYSIRVSSPWTGTITPSKTGFIFSPASASFTNLTASQTIQNFNATAIYVISGNTGVGGVTLSYTNGTPLTVTSDAAGNYSISVPQGWTGTVTPSKPAYSFTPANRSYTNLSGNQTAQNYTATFITYTISGNVGVAGVTLLYTDVTQQFAASDAAGNYSITVPQGWSGTITPRRAGNSFSPANRSYTSLAASQTAQNFTASVCNSCADKDTTGVFRPSNGLLFLKNLNITGFADVALNYGLPGDYPVVGDWDGDGDTTIGIYRNGSFFLRNSNTIGFAEIVFPFGSPGDQPIAGDWDNNGTDTVGVFRTATGEFFLRNTNSEGLPDASFVLGNPGDVAIAGDWDGNGSDTTGVFRPANGLIFLKNTNTTGIADVALNYGAPGDKPVVGDWDNNGTDTIGVYRGNTFYLRNSNTNGFGEIVFSLGNPGDFPIAGDWDNLP
jgi:hypothetical protein